MKLVTRKLCGAVVLGAFCLQAAPVSAGGRPDLVQQSLDAGRPYETGVLLVQFLAGTSRQEQDSALAAAGVSRDHRVLSAATRRDRRGDLDVVRVPAGMNLRAAMAALQARRAVDFAEPNWIYQHQVTSNDPYFTSGQLYGMYGDQSTPANAFGSQAAEAWGVNHACSANVYVGVIDEGFMYSHEDLQANSWTNPFDPVDGIDNDGNGYVDDVHGWDFAGNDNSTFDGLSDDHGTHVSGTIAASGGNGKGVVGVCWNAKLISGKFLGQRGGSTENAIKALNYFTDLKLRHGLNIVATNNSWGGGGFSQALADAITSSGDANILFVAAAGNDGVDNDVSPHYPAAYTNDSILTVASITSTGMLSSFSNYGAVSVDIGAPGSGIMSTVPTRSGNTIVSGYASYSGTSMATPHVTGAAALYASTHPGLTALQLKQAILDAGTPTLSLRNKTLTGDRLNAGGF